MMMMRRRRRSQGGSGDDDGGGDDGGGDGDGDTRDDVGDDRSSWSPWEARSRVSPRDKCATLEARRDRPWKVKNVRGLGFISSRNSKLS